MKTLLSERWLAECAMGQYGTVVIVYLLAEFACVGRGGGLAEQGREQQGAREAVMDITPREDREASRCNNPRPTWPPAPAAKCPSKSHGWVCCCVASYGFLNHSTKRQRLLVGRRERRADVFNQPISTAAPFAFHSSWVPMHVASKPGATQVTMCVLQVHSRLTQHLWS